MRLPAAIFSVLLPLASCLADPVEVPDGSYRPLYRSQETPLRIPVTKFRMDATPVTNGEFLEFVRANPSWQRSQVKRLFADESYLRHWEGDLTLGAGCDARQPVTFVPWFAAKAYAKWKGGRLPTIAEWERAAATGITVADGAKDPEFLSAMQRWYSTPTPERLPQVGADRANLLGIHDLHGLVWEWTSDFNSSLVTNDSRQDMQPSENLFCGAGAMGVTNPSDYAAFMRQAFRSSLKASYTVHNLGFRCAYD